MASMDINTFARIGVEDIGLSRERVKKPHKRTTVRLLILFIFTLGISSCCQASTTYTTYHVATSGNDLNPGSQSQPWKTIQKAAATMVAGDTVIIHGGTYYEEVSPVNSGTKGEYITYQNYGDEEVIIDAQGGTRSGCITINGKEYLRFIGLHLQNAGFKDLNAAFGAFPGSNHLVLDHMIAETSRFGIMLKGGKTSSEDPDKAVSFVTIKNSTIRNNAAYGVFLYYKVTDSVIGPGNIIYNENEKNGVPVDDQYGIDLDTNYPGNPSNGSRRITIIGNEVYGNRIQGIRPWNAQNVLIKDNYTHHNGATGIQVEDGCANVIIDGNRSEYNAQSYEYETGIWIDSTVNAVVQNNLVRGNQIGLMVTSTERALVRNNIIYENNRAPSGSNIMGAVLNSNSANITFVHNTLWKNGASASRGNLAYCIKPPVTNTVIKNNIFSESAGEYDGWMNCAVISDFNNLYNSRNLAMYWSGEVHNWKDYLDTSGQDSHTITNDPLLVNPAGGDFSLSGQSPDIDSGSDLTQTTAAGSGMTVPLGDARYFTDGLGLLAGDTVRIGEVTAVVKKVDYTDNTITVDRQIIWKRGDSVSYLYSGTKPDRGAKEAGSLGELPALPLDSGTKVEGLWHAFLPNWPVFISNQFKESSKNSKENKE
jgi:parallel beta-helix repeat protein